MKATKTETITVRIEPAVKAGLEAMAEQERRSIANMIEVMIRDYCGGKASRFRRRRQPGQGARKPVSDECARKPDWDKA